MTTQAEIEAAAQGLWAVSLKPLGQRWVDDTIDKDWFRMLAKAALKAAERVRWQPIESAPLNGDEILGAVALGWGPLILSWDNLEWRDSEGVIYEPTNWHPLPPPPESK